MKKSTRTLDDIKQLHQEGELKDATHAYLDYLGHHPDDAEALHLLGLLLAERGNIKESREYLSRAHVAAPEDIGIQLHLANIFKAQNQYDEAIELLDSVIAANPDCAPALNNLGTVYFAKQQFGLAVKAYQEAIDLRPDFADAYYNMGLACARLQRDEEALAAYEALIHISPDHPGARFQMACLMMKRERLFDAIREFTAIAESYSYHFESHANLAACYLRMGRLKDACTWYMRALTIVPEDKDTLFNLGVIHMRQGYAKEAIGFYQRAVKVDPDFYDAHNNLGTALLVRQDNPKALLHFQEALRLRPDNEALRHTVRVMMHDKSLTSSPPEYIQSLFDSYAENYETHLKTSLQYLVPEKLLPVVQKTGILQPSSLDILDIGCGTGLCGELLKPYARKLTGVDLSKNMLAVAANKNIYDDLVVAEVVTYLKHHQGEYDLVVAGDVLVYFGELEELLAGIAQALKSGGYLAFNVEISEDQDFVLTPTGRFAHKKSYIEQLAVENGYTVKSTESIELRSQHDKSVPGYLCLWQR